MGHELVIARPSGYALDDELMSEIKGKAEGAGGSLTVTRDVDAAFEGAEVVYAKSWGSKDYYGAAHTEIAARAVHRDRWIVDEKKMARTRGAIFMHCLPVRRNVIVTDAVIDSPASVVVDEAENRLHAQKAVMAKLLGEGRR
jgi:N-acetylornithine carbamoyltransferase